MTGTDLYSVLGVDRTCSQAEIKSTYRARAKKFHPDKAGPESAEAFRSLVQAYRILRDEKKRRAYDEDGSFDEKHELSIHQKAVTILAEAFDSVLGSDAVFDKRVSIIDLIGELVDQRHFDIEVFVKKGRERLSDLEKLKKRIKKKDDSANIFVEMIERRIKVGKKRISSAEEEIEVMNAARNELRTYETVEEMVRTNILLGRPTIVPTRLFNIGTATS